MHRVGWSLATLTALGFAFALSACGDARKAVGGGTSGTDCTGCHGTAGRTGLLPGTDANLAAAPPAAPSGAPAQVIGAHQAHLNPPVPSSLAHPLAGPLACSECHVVPTDTAHATSPPAQIVQFGPLAKTATANPGTPAWNGVTTPSGITTPTCSSVYCHGSFTWGTVTGNAFVPDWTLGSGQATCGKCHGLPPTGHIALPAGVTCNGCHPGTVDANYNIIVDPATGLSLHVNGKVDEGAHAAYPNWLTATGGDHTAAALNQSPPFASCLACHVGFGAADPTDVAGSSCNACHGSVLTGATTANWQQNCVFCHGDNTKLLTWTGTDPQNEIAPPRGAGGETLTTDRAVGAHQLHVNAANNTLSAPVTCNVCHVDSLNPFPTDLTHVNGVVEVPLAGTLGSVTVGGTWNGSGGAAATTCSNTYCHGNFGGGTTANTPDWVNARANACGTCHAVPPTDGQHPLHVGTIGLTCDTCHPTGYSTTTVAQAVHVNGAKDLAPSSTFGTFSNWNPTTTNVNGWMGTATGCHTATRYWYPGSGTSCQ
jgi:predicted CxxxxCH...CXXCH cytochrome family protein